MPALRALRDEHLAELNRRARELDVPRYRMLPRDDLIEAIAERSEGEPEAEAESQTEAEPQARAESKGDAEPETEPEAEGEREADPEAKTETEEIAGVLDRMPQGYGFIRLSGLSEADGDVYVSASQIRRCGLRPADEVRVPARAPRPGERHRALVH